MKQTLNLAQKAVKPVVDSLATVWTVSFTNVDKSNADKLKPKPNIKGVGQSLKEFVP